MSARFRGLPKRQDEVFAEICTGNSHPRAAKSTLDALAEKGLIVSREVVVGRDCLGPITVYEYDVAGYAIHYEWCQFCAENFPIPDAAAPPVGRAG